MHTFQVHTKRYVFSLAAVWGAFGGMFTVLPILNWLSLIKFDEAYGGIDVPEVGLFVVGLAVFWFPFRLLWLDPYLITIDENGMVNLQRIFGKSTTIPASSILPISKGMRRFGMGEEGESMITIKYAGSEIHVPPLWVPTL